MTNESSWRAWAFILLVFGLAPAALGVTRTMSSKSSSGFGQDLGVSQWLLSSPNVTVNGVTVHEQVICTGQDVSGNKCTSGGYSFLYQVVSPGPFVITFGHLSGFAYDTAFATFGAMSCDQSLGNTIALCGYDATILSSVGFDTPNATLSISVPSTGSLGYITLFVQEAQLAGNLPMPPQLSINGLSLTPQSLTLGGQTEGIPGIPQTLTLTNIFANSLSITGLSLPPGFQSTNACGSIVAAAATCAVSIQSVPQGAGLASGNLGITDSSILGTEVVPMRAYGSPSGITLAPGTLTFGTQVSGTNGTGVLHAVLSNPTANPFTIGTIFINADPNTLAAEFALQNTSNCADFTVVPAGGSCTLDVGFPNGTADKGELTGTLTVTDLNSADTFTLALRGFAGVVAADITNLTFGSQTVGTTSSTQTVTFTNNTGGAFNVINVNASADFTAATGTCVNASNPVGVNNAANCTVDVAFSPTAPGVRTGTVTIAADLADASQVIAVTGGGPVAQLSPSVLDLGSQPIGATYHRLMNLTNNSYSALTITNISITGANAGDFNVSGPNCPASPNPMAAGASCYLDVSFSPTAAGPRRSSVSITDDAAGSPQTALLTGFGAASFVFPATLSFNGQNVNTSSTVHSTTLNNSGSAPLNIWQIAITGSNAADFSKTTTCGSTLAASSACLISVTFTPTSTGTRTATLWVNDDGGGGPQTVALSGIGLAPIVSLSATALSFPDQTLSVTSSPQTITLSNVGSGPLTISSASVTGANSGDFAVQTNTCLSTLAAATSCTINVTFTPLATGPRKSSLSIVDNAAGSPRTIILTGVGTAQLLAPASGTVKSTSSGILSRGSGLRGASLNLSASTIKFGPQRMGLANASQQIVLRNLGSVPLLIGKIEITGANADDFDVTNTCGANLEAGESCTLQVSFTPQERGARNAWITIEDNSAKGRHQVRLQGTGREREKSRQ